MKYKYYSYIVVILSICQSTILAQTSDISKSSKTKIWSDNMPAEMLNHIFDYRIESTFDSWYGFNWIQFEFDKSYHVDSIVLFVSRDIDFTKPKFSIELQSGSFKIKKAINNLRTRFIIDSQLDELLLLKENAPEWNFGRITEIEIHAKTNVNIDSRPKTKFSYKKNIEINDKISGLSKEQASEKRRKWRSYKRIYKRNFKPYFTTNDKEDIEEYISKENEYSYCSITKSFIEENGEINKELLEVMASKTDCRVEDLYFDYNIDFPKEFYKSKYFRYKDIEYGNKDDIKFLEDIVRKGDAHAGHAAEHLALMKSYSSFPLIYNLRHDDNVYAQFTALKTSKYLGKNAETLEIAKSMVKQELDCITADTLSCYGPYAGYAVIELLGVYPNEALELIKQLYMAYIEFYPRNYFEPKYIDEHRTFEIIEENIIPSEVENRIYSFRGSDQRFEEEIKKMVNKYPHWIKNETVKYILEEARIRRQPITRDDDVR